MDFQQRLIKGTFIKRYKRFFADIEIDGKKVTAHVANTGSMKGCDKPGSPCLISKANDPERKLQYNLEAIQVGKTWVGVNTGWPNKIAVELFKTKNLSHWDKYNKHQTEVKINEESRIDLVLWNSVDKAVDKWKLQDFQKVQPVHFVEVKNVTLAEGKIASFPDAVTLRGQKHINELCALIKRGYSAEMVFIVQRDDVDFFAAAVEIDPIYARLLKEGIQKGLVVTALSFTVSDKGIYLAKKLALNI